MDTIAKKLMARRLANASVSYLVGEEKENVWNKTYTKAMKWCDKRLCKEYDNDYRYFAPYWDFEDSKWIAEHYTDNGYIDVKGNLIPYDAEGWSFEVKTQE